jgi:hypothetical protein
MEFYGDNRVCARTPARFDFPISFFACLEHGYEHLRWTRTHAHTQHAQTYATRTHARSLARSHAHTHAHTHSPSAVCVSIVRHRASALFSLPLLFLLLLLSLYRSLSPSSVHPHSITQHALPRSASRVLAACVGHVRPHRVLRHVQDDHLNPVEQLRDRKECG